MCSVTHRSLLRLQGHLGPLKPGAGYLAHPGAKSSVLCRSIVHAILYACASSRAQSAYTSCDCVLCVWRRVDLSACVVVSPQSEPAKQLEFEAIFSHAAGHCARTSRRCELRGKLDASWLMHSHSSAVGAAVLCVVASNFCTAVWQALRGITC